MREPSRATAARPPPEETQRTLQSLAYIIECDAKGSQREAMDEFSRLCRKLECDKAYRLPNSNALLSRLRTATTEYNGTELRRKAVNDICGLNRKLWREVVGP